MMRIALVGAAGHASDLLGALEFANAQAATPQYDVVGLFVDPQYPVENPARFAGRTTVAGTVDELATSDADHYIAAVGYPRGRRAIVERLDGVLPAATVIHPTAELSTGVTVGEGSFVHGGVRISPLARIGRHVYVSQLGSVGHDTIVGDFTSLMPGVLISGDVTIGAGALVGSGAIVLEKLTIGEGAVVGAGAVVVKDVPPGATVLGIPAR